MIFNDGRKKRIKEVLSEKGKGLILKEIHINEESKHICDDLAELINFAAKEYEHVNLVKYVKAYYDPSIFTIITEKVPLTLNEIIINNEKALKIFIKHILNAVQYLHQNEIYNLNLKESNILVTQNGELKIRDYIGKTFFDILEFGS